MTDPNTTTITTTTTTTSTETLIVIREVVPQTDASTSPLLLLYNILCRKKINRALFHTVATTIEHSDTNGQATAATTRSRLPMGMNGIISEQDFDSFCAALNEQIKAYDAILTRRRKIARYRNAFLLFLFFINTKFVLDPLYNSDRGMVYTVLMYFVACMLYVAMFTLPYLLFKHPMLKVIDKQNAIYQNVNDACSAFARTMSTEMTVSSPTPSSSSSPAPTILPCIVRVTCTLQSLGYNDDIGRYNNMDHIKFTVTTKTRACTDENQHDVYMDTPELNHIDLSAHPTVTSILHIV